MHVGITGIVILPNNPQRDKEDPWLGLSRFLFLTLSLVEGIVLTRLLKKIAIVIITTKDNPDFSLKGNLIKKYYFQGMSSSVITVKIIILIKDSKKTLA